MIKNAKDVPLFQNSGTVPNMAGALRNWMQPMLFFRITKSVVAFQNVEEREEYRFNGVWQPLSPQVVQQKPEGQRDWKWFTCHTLTALELIPDDVIEYLGTSYRLMPGKLDYALYGYYEYHLVEDYEGDGT